MLRSRYCFCILCALTALVVALLLLTRSDQAVAQEDTWEAKARAACLTYMRVAASNPSLTRTLVLEVQAGGGFLPLSFQAGGGR